VGKITIKEDLGFGEISDYFWVNIEVNGVRVGKMRLMPSKEKLTIQSITIFPEFQRKGYAKEVVDHYKGKYNEIIADRTRNTARGFWEKMRFVNNGDGDYVWRRKLAQGQIKLS